MSHSERGRHAGTAEPVPRVNTGTCGTKVHLSARRARARGEHRSVQHQVEPIGVYCLAAPAHGARFRRYDGDPIPARKLTSMRMPLLAIAAAVLATAAHAQDYPKLKAGQWEMTISRAKADTGIPPTQTTICTDDAVQKEMIAMGTGTTKEICTKNEFKRDGARFIGNSECKIGDSRIISRTVMTMSGDTGYRTEINSTYDPPFMGMKESQTTLVGKHVGPCRDGLVPGDFVGPTGQKFNIKGIGSGKSPLPSTQPARPSKVPQ